MPPPSSPSPSAVPDAAARARIDALVDRGMSQLEGKRHEQAIAAFDEVLSIAPDHLVAGYQRANAFLAKGATGDARAACDAALARLPGQPDLRNAPGTVAAIERGVTLVQAGAASALCTAPIAKKVLVDGALALSAALNREDNGQ